MGFELTRPIALLGGLIALGIVVLAWWRFPPPLPRLRGRLSLALRMVIVALLILSLGGFGIQTTPKAQSLVVAADLSASVETALDAETAAVRQILSARRGDNRVGVLSFARDPQVESPVGTAPQFTEFQNRPNRNYTDPAAALRLAGSIMPGDTRRHIVLISDGRANLGDAIGEARLLHAEGIRVDTVALPVPVGPEVYVDRVSAPRTLQQGEQAQVRALIVSNTETPAIVRWFLDRTLLATSQLTLQAGETTLTQTVTPADPGFHSIRLVIDPTRDTYSENNVGEALMQVLGPASVLLVEGKRGAAANLATSLKSVGMVTQTTGPNGLPRTAAGLAQFQTIVLINVPAADLGTDAMNLLQTSVRDLGMGLVVIGGDQSYGPGGYAGTPLEATLPVQIELREDARKPPVAVILVMESMEDPQGDQVVRGAAQAVIDQLTPRDQVGITNATTGFAVPLGFVKDKTAIKNTIGSMPLGDGPYAPYLIAADETLSHTQAAIKHVILLGDGDEFDDYQPLINRMRGHGITLSTVGVNTHNQPAFMTLLQNMAQWGHGRFYQSNGPQDVPRILLKETRDALKPWIVEGSITPRLTSLAEVLPGIPLASFPNLKGYVATTSRAAADTVLKSPDDDPLLAAWQYGLGRVVAWTSDSEGRWTADLLSWPSGNRFFGDLVRYALPAPGDPALQVESVIRGDRAHLLVSSPVISGASVTVTAVAPDLQEEQVTLSPTGPGRFEGDLKADQVGSYLLRVTESEDGAVRHATTTGMVVPYSPEYRELGTDRASLEAIARAGGGTLLGDPAEAFRVPVPPIRTAKPLSELLLILAIILFPLDIALRRLIFRLEDLPAWRAALRPARAAAAPAEATLARLRGRVEGIRIGRRTAQKPEPPPEPLDPTAELLARRRRRKQ